MTRWDGIGPQCEKCKGLARRVFICDACEYPEDECICEAQDNED